MCSVFLLGNPFCAFCYVGVTLIVIDEQFGIPTEKRDLLKSEATVTSDKQ